MNASAGSLLACAFACGQIMTCMPAGDSKNEPHREKKPSFFFGKIGNMPHPGHVNLFLSHRKIVKFFITPNVAHILIMHQIQTNLTLMLIVCFCMHRRSHGHCFGNTYILLLHKAIYVPSFALAIIWRSR